MVNKEEVFRIMEDIIAQIDSKDEVFYSSLTSEEEEAIHVLQRHKVVLVSSRFSKNFLFPGENFNKLLSQGSEKFFSSEDENKIYIGFLGGFSKGEWVNIFIIIILFLVIFFLCLTALVTF